MKIQRLSSALLLFALVIGTVAFAPQARGQDPNATLQGEDCSFQVVNRSYSQGFEGFLNVPLLNPAAPLGLVPNAGAGFLTFLPDGKWTGQYTIAIGMLGLFQNVPIENGVYSVSFDTSKNPAACTGTMTGSAVFGPPLGTLPVNFQLVVAEEGRRIETIHTDTSLIVGISGSSVRPFGCSNETLNAKYSDNAEGWGLAAPSGPLSFPPPQLLAGYFPFAFSGAMEFHPRVPPSLADFPGAPAGSGSVKFWDTVSLNGTIIPRAGRGWYEVHPDCTATMVLTDNLGNPDFHLKMFVGKNGKALDLINIDTVTITGLPAPVPAFILYTTLNRMAERNEGND